MQSRFEKRERHFGEPQERPQRNVLLGTGLVLLLAFLLIVVLFFIFSAMAPSLMGRCVAVVDIDMPLTVDGAPPTLFEQGYLGSEELAAIVDDLDERDDVGAVVFVFNSPGGSVVATREVYDSVKELDKPKVAYFREVAASGAYYIASGTDYIVSDPDALTGSIGVIATFTEMSGLFEKIGVNVTTVKSGRYKDIGSPYRNMTSEEHQILQELVDEVYSEFRTVVIENRGKKLDMERFENVTDGRILTGRQAVRVGLVDETGTKDDAILKAAEMANISAESVDDLRVCKVGTSVGDGGLISVESILSMLTADSSGTELNFR